MEAPMTIIAFECGPVQTMAYLVIDETTAEAVIVDTPPGSAELLIPEVERRGLRIAAIVITHGHWDHVGEVARIASRLRAPAHIHADDAAQLRSPSTFGYPMPPGIVGMEADAPLPEGATIVCGGFTLEVLHVPGHTPGHVCLLERAQGILFSGDVLFAGSIGRTDLPGGSYDTLMEQIRLKLMTLPDEVIVYPGHGPSTTIGRERRRNPFILEYLDHFDDA
jgi:glyoxylase-like metal-dependent hydrolase (beta-lactamase superfamily II)